ncbi:MAG: LTA synthase family protein, partial [Thauera sp.]|nr:LTA synthase family protein [Thauera sp.]
MLLLSWLLVFFLTRTVLLLAHLADADAGLFDVLRLYGIGLVYDLSFLLYAALPPALYVLLCPKWLWRSKGHTLFLHVLTGLALFAMLFVAVAEWLFWDEFGVRFNFIAVDYLVYSDEVINNILESYPIYPVLAFLVLLAMAATVGLRSTLKRALAAPLLQKSAALLYVGALAVAAFAVSAVIGQNFPLAMGGNVFQRELASNGPFQFFAAFRNNELDYQQFYATLPDPRAAALLRAELSEPVARFVGSDPLDIRRAIDNPGLEQRRNLVLVTIESLSAKYLGSFGDRRGLTPNLDALRDQR